MSQSGELTAIERAWRAIGKEFGQVVGARVRPVAPRQERPIAWTVVVVLDRLEEVYRVLARLPIATRPRAYASSMPAYVHDRLTFKDLIDMDNAGDVAADARDRHRDRSRPRADEIQRAEEAMSWPGRYIADPDMARIVQLSALWTVIGADPAEMIARYHIYAPAFGALRIEGLKRITVGLIRDGVPVS